VGRKRRSGHHPGELVQGPGRAQAQVTGHARVLELELELELELALAPALALAPELAPALELAPELASIVGRLRVPACESVTQLHPATLVGERGMMAWIPFPYPCPCPCPCPRPCPYPYPSHNPSPRPLPFPLPCPGPFPCQPPDSWQHWVCAPSAPSVAPWMTAAPWTSALHPHPQWLGQAAR